MESRETEKQRERTKDVFRVLQMVGISEQGVDQLQRSLGGNISNEVEQAAADMRGSARKLIASAGMQADDYIEDAVLVRDDAALEADGSSPPEELIGALALLGTTERKLEELDFDATMELRRGILAVRL